MSSNGIYTALSGALAQSTALDVTANNVANASTTGYQAERTKFSEALTKAKDAAYVKATAGGIDTSPGTVSQTGNPLDVAISGDGYFGLNTAQGVRYTRAGAFRVDAQHQLVGEDGSAVRGKDGKPIAIPADAPSVRIAGDGSVQAGDQIIGSLELTRFDPAQLQRAGAATYIAAAGAKPITTGPAPTLQPGSLEGANFNVVHGMVDLVKQTRSYEALHKMIETYKDIDDRAARGIAGNG